MKGKKYKNKHNRNSCITVADLNHHLLKYSCLNVNTDTCVYPFAFLD